MEEIKSETSHLATVGASQTGCNRRKGKLNIFQIPEPVQRQGSKFQSLSPYTYGDVGMKSPRAQEEARAWIFPSPKAYIKEENQESLREMNHHFDY